MRFQSVSFVKARLQLSETLSPAKSLRSGDKDNLISFFFCTVDDLFGRFHRAHWTVFRQRQKNHERKNHLRPFHSSHPFQQSSTPRVRCSIASLPSTPPPFVLSRDHGEE